MRKMIYFILMGIILAGCQNDTQTNEQPAKDTGVEEQVTGDTEENNDKDLKDKDSEQTENTEENEEESIDNEETPAEAEKEEAPNADKPANNQTDQETGEPEKQTEPENSPANENKLTVVEDPNSIELVVNKQRKLPDGYKPPDLVEPNVSFYASEGDPKRLMRKEAAAALEELFAGAKQSGLDFVAVSGYRSYDRQKVIYENNVANNGQAHADKYSARPGTSEHQTGLAMDVASAALVSVLEPSFIQTDEGKWLAENAHQYGFVIRYLEGKEHITGYSYEPWHIRFVGKENAAEIYEQQLTLEEFFGLYP
ncbi:D-alanyl-D-alanine carboxypeptidase [Gracilibacillus ureilyticus]|uniref:D-alanyl-D-alanine carboxypeptidase n=1 Tax=Gracilibacillus ureilyticus TaxID=531814 RepID=A0A1H9SJF4_9BACI|nr:D-alanyl-D-alanine carboxypeptidase family protein [Gracilibacillus ureilyticus]SER84493.1 D-alanyl-D-alanine carboxypeptidase [Gracilibacillus ureilyticus]